MGKIPIIREDDGEMLGFIEQDATGWTGQTVFGYIFTRGTTKASVEQIVRLQGLTILQGVWQYFDRDDNAWHACVLREVYENKVVVIRTNDMGYQDPDDYKIVTITSPTETDLVKA